MTVELETADLVDLAQSGQLDGRAIKTIALDTLDLVDIRAAEAVVDPNAPPKVIVESEPSIIVDEEVLPPAAATVPIRQSQPMAIIQTPGPHTPSAGSPVAVQKIEPYVRRIAEPPLPKKRTSGNLLVILLYALAAGALMLALYKRFAG